MTYVLPQWFKARSNEFYNDSTYLNHEENAPVGSLSFDQLDQHLLFTNSLMNHLVKNGYATGDPSTGWEITDPQRASKELISLSESPKYKDRIGQWQRDVFRKYNPLIETIQAAVKGHKGIEKSLPKLYNLGVEISKQNYGNSPSSEQPTLTHFFAFSFDPQKRGRGFLYRNPAEISELLKRPPPLQALAENNPHVVLGKHAIQYIIDPHRINLLNASRQIRNLFHPETHGGDFSTAGGIMARNILGAGLQAGTNRAGQLAKSINVKSMLYQIEPLFDLNLERAVDLCKGFLNNEPELKEILNFNNTDIRSLNRTIKTLYLLKKGKVDIQELRKSYSVIDRAPIDPNVLPDRDRKRKENESGRSLDEPVVSSYVEEIVRQYPDSEFIDMMMLRMALDNYVDARRQ